MKKNGFTLIELLAVIVILAIIALIATPIILNVIEKTKLEAIKESANGYKDAIEKYIAMHEVDEYHYGYNLRGKTLKISEVNADIPALNNIINVKGEKPIDGEVEIDEKGNVVRAEIIYEEAVIKCDKDKCISEKNDVLTIRYDVNGGVLDKEFDNVKRGGTLVLPIPTRETYGFDGWYTSENELVDNNTKFNQSMTLVAHWDKNKYTIVFDAGEGGTSSEGTKSVSDGGTIDLPNAEKEGYTFNGWYDENGNEVTSETVWTEPHTIHAEYTINSYTLTLENAKFNDNTTSKTLEYNTEVEIIAVLPSDYTDSNYSGNTACSSDSHIGNIKYKVKHEYSLENWNVENTTNKTITYHVPAENKTVTANIIDNTTEVDKYECYAYSASYSSGSYYCSGSGWTRSGQTCTKTTTTTTSATYHDGYYSCPNSTVIAHYSLSGSKRCHVMECTKVERDPKTGVPTYCSAMESRGYINATYNAPYYSCSSGTLSGSECVTTTTETKSASYSSGYYYCSSGGTQSGSTCYNMRSIN